MLFYWMMFTIPVLALLFPYRATPDLSRIQWLVVMAIFTTLIGMRHEIGGDWGAYLNHYERVIGISFDEAIKISDPGYAFLNWISGLIGGGIYFVNLVCGAIVMLGVIMFSRSQPQPWLALLVATPYMIIVVAMGYTRQSVAIGFELLALLALMHGRMLRFVLLIAIGALFHKTALVLLPLTVLASSHIRMWTLLWVGLTGYALVSAILIEHYEIFIQSYVESKMVSEGGPIRIAMNSLPAVLLLMFRRKLTPDENERRLWVWMAIFSLACIPLINLASTAVDRIALYFMPIQLYVFSRIHLLFADRIFKCVVVMSVILYYGLVQWVWLNFAIHASYWVPYRFYPFF